MITKTLKGLNLVLGVYGLASAGLLLARHSGNYRLVITYFAVGFFCSWAAQVGSE